jgi:hypothetical protein
MNKLEAKLKIKGLLEEANMEMVTQNQGSSVSRSYGRYDRLMREVHQIQEKYDV